jgi:hypothetical protein
VDFGGISQLKALLEVLVVECNRGNESFGGFSRKEEDRDFEENRGKTTVDCFSMKENFEKLLNDS